MSKKSFIPKIFHFGFKQFNESGKLELNKFIIILVLSVVVTYGVAIADALRRNNLFGAGGLPLRFTSGATFLGEASTDTLPLILDVTFWFVILFGIWKLILRAIKS